MSGEDLLTKFDDLVKRFRSEFNDIIEGERAKMKAELDAYNAEKQRMKAVEVSDNDIIELNVGGHKLTTKRSTLCQVEGSLLASMFSGRWEQGRINVPRGPWHIIGAGPLDPPPPPKPPNGILNPEFSKIKKYHFVFHALKIRKRKRERITHQ